MRMTDGEQDLPGPASGSQPAAGGSEPPNDDPRPLGERNYQPIAARFAELAPAKPHNAYYDRPAVLSLLPDLRGRRVLDAGCGPGIYAEILVERGAEVVGVDVTPAMVELARQRLGDRATILRHDLEQPLAFAADSSFDVVVCALVLDYIRDWRPVMREFARVLRPGGCLVFSCSHPFFDWHRYGQERYFDVERYRVLWRGLAPVVAEMEAYRRPMQEVLNPVVEAGLVLDRLLEPLPTEEFRQADPEVYASLMRSPGFLCVRACKP